MEAVTEGGKETAGRGRKEKETISCKTWPGNHPSSQPGSAIPLSPARLSLFIFLCHTGK